MNSVGDTYTDGESIVTVDESDGPLREVSETEKVKFNFWSCYLNAAVNVLISS